jgi:hypothetical protein
MKSIFELPNFDLLSMESLLSEESGASDFGNVYLILVFAIAALLLVLIVKPMYQSSLKTIPKTVAK